jgi:pilus assembly protein Flp/PilA
MVQYLQILLNARFAKTEERGASAVEYGLLVTLIALAIIAGATALGGGLDTLFSNAASNL